MRSLRQKWNEVPSLRCSATRTFSSTVRCGNTAEIWNERARPMRAMRRRRAGDVAPLVEDAARGRLQEVRQQVEAGGLAGAIGADQGMNAAAPHLEADALDGDEALEFLG